MYDNYIFDLYGTLVEIRTNEDKYYLWNKMSEIYASLGASYTPGELKKAYGMLIKEQLKEIPGAYPEPDVTKVFERLYLQKGIPCSLQQARMSAITFRTLSRQVLYVYKGVKETLQMLRDRGKGVYLLSNAQTDFTRPELEMMGLTPYFDGILISSEEKCKKPSPEFFDRLFGRYHLEPEKCLMVGNDETSDIAGACMVGMDSLYIHTAISPKVSGVSKAAYTVMDGDWQKVKKLLYRICESGLSFENL